MPKTMDPLLPTVSILRCWAIVLGTFGGPGVGKGAEKAGSWLKAKRRAKGSRGKALGKGTGKGKAEKASSKRRVRKQPPAETQETPDKFGLRPS